MRYDVGVRSVACVVALCACGCKSGPKERSADTPRSPVTVHCGVEPTTVAEGVIDDQPCPGWLALEIHTAGPIQVLKRNPEREFRWTLNPEPGVTVVDGQRTRAIPGVRRLVLQAPKPADALRPSPIEVRIGDRTEVLSPEDFSSRLGTGRRHSLCDVAATLGSTLPGTIAVRGDGTAELTLPREDCHLWEVKFGQKGIPRLRGEGGERLLQTIDAIILP